ncbi:MAG: carboxylesterase family protein [Thermoguttaceae bacterium]
MSVNFQRVLAALLCSLLLVDSLPAADSPLQRQTAFGIVEGCADDASKVWAWNGIPFAKPPVGDQRWRAPADPESWVGVRVATEYPPQCIQPRLAPPLTLLTETTGSEDRLYLNIYRPQTSEENLPVYFWIHGGGNVFGNAGGLYVQELDIVRKANIVLVEVQYRLVLCQSWIDG